MRMRGTAGRLAAAIACTAAGALVATSSAHAIVFQNNAPITIPAAGQANPYPATIAVGGGRQITDLNVILSLFSHAHPDDIQVAVKSPNGTSYLLMDGAGGGTDVVDEGLTFDDEAATQIPNTAALTTSSYKPGAHDVLQDFPAPGPLTSEYRNPGPAAGGSAQLAAFDGSNPNGVWKLFVVDTGFGDGGQILNGWAIDVTQTAADPILLGQLTALTTIPASGSDQNTVNLDGSADPFASATVQVFKTADCTGPVAATGSPQDLINGDLSTTVPDNSTTTFSVNQTNGTGTSNCSDPVTYIEVTPPPTDPTIPTDTATTTTTTNPGNPANQGNPNPPGQTKPKCKKPKKGKKGAAAAKGCKKKPKKK